MQAPKDSALSPPSPLPNAHPQTATRTRSSTPAWAPASAWRAGAAMSARCARGTPRAPAWLTWTAAPAQPFIPSRPPPRSRSTRATCRWAGRAFAKLEAHAGMDARPAGPPSAAPRCAGQPRTAQHAPPRWLAAALPQAPGLESLLRPAFTVTCNTTTPAPPSTAAVGGGASWDPLKDPSGRFCQASLLPAPLLLFSDRPTVCFLADHSCNLDWLPPLYDCSSTCA